MKTHEILPGLLYQRGSTLRMKDESLFAGLEERDYGTVVCCARRVRDARLADWVEDRGGTYCYVPFPDGNKVPEWIPAVAIDLAGQLNTDHPTLIQCHAGRNRSALLSALIVRAHLGITGSAALAHLRSARPNSLANPYFAAYLDALDAPL